MDIAKIREKAKKKRDGDKDKEVPSLKEGKASPSDREEERPLEPPLKEPLKEEPTLEKDDTPSEAGTTEGDKPATEEETPLLKEEIEIPTEDVYRRSLEGEKDTGEYLEILTFLVDKEEFALTVTEVREIIKLREITEVPNTPPFIKGIISLRGEIIPIIDLRERFGMEPKTPDRASRIIIAAKDDDKTGMIVDSVRHVLKLPENGIEPPPPLKEGIDIEFIKGIGHMNKRFIVLLELQRVIEIPELEG